MSLQSALVKLAIKLTPSVLIIWIANILLKGIAELSRFDFDLDERRLFVQTRLYGEEDSIDVVLEDFAVFHDGEAYRVIVHQANSDRLWLNNVLARITGKAWKIPAMPQFASQLDLLAEVFQSKAETENE